MHDKNPLAALASTENTTLARFQLVRMDREKRHLECFVTCVNRSKGNAVRFQRRQTQQKSISNFSILKLVEESDN